MFTAIALAAVLAAAPSPAPSDAEVRAQVEALLGTIDTPVPAERLAALGPVAGQVLAEVAASGDELPSRRTKALVALGTVDAARARELSLALVDAADAPVTVRQAAVRTLGRTMSPVQLRAALSPVLRAGRPASLKAVAAETLARHGGDGACAEVMDQVSLEPGDARPAFDRAAALCAGKR